MNRQSLKRNQQQKLKNLLESAVKRNKKLEEEYANQVIAIQKDYDLKLDATSGTSKAELQQAKRCGFESLQETYAKYYLIGSSKEWRKQ